MGIPGLLNLIRNESEFEMVDLVKEAENKNGIEILVDFNAIIRFMTESFIKKIARDFDNEYLSFLIGDYEMFINAICDLQKGFEDAGIRLVWIVDGPKGVDEMASEQKEETWISRDQKDVIAMDEVLQKCRDKEPLSDLNNLAPLAHFETALLALKKAGAEVINLLKGESDDFIAYEFHRRKSFAIFTNDTDFVIFKDCVVLFDRLLNFHYNNDILMLPFIDNDNPGKIFRKPAKLMVPLVKQCHVLRLFQFNNCSQIIALSILKGNDNTVAFASELQYHLNITKNPNKTPHVTHVAQFIRRRAITADNLDNLADMKTFIIEYPEFKEAIKFTKDLYSLRRIEENMKKGGVIYDPSTNDDSLTGFLAKKLSTGELSKKVYSIHFGILHDCVCPENPSDQCPPILSLLFEVRKQIYPYVLDEKLKEVVEWRSRYTDLPVKVPVKHASFKTNMIKGLPEEDDKYGLDKYGIDLFEEVFSHQEDNGSLNYVKKYGFKEAFVCYLLRYFYRLTKDKNLRVHEKEFRALFVTVYYQFSRSKDVTFKTQLNNDVFLGMNICPSERCMIIATWFMNIFYTAKYLCGGAFNLTEEFPDIPQILSGPVFYAFYENVMCDDNERTLHLENSLMESVGLLEEDIMTKYGEEYSIINE